MRFIKGVLRKIAPFSGQLPNEIRRVDQDKIATNGVPWAALVKGRWALALPFPYEQRRPGHPSP